MKAYYIELKDDPDQGGHLVWDTTSRRAKKRVNESQLDWESWLDIRCTRWKAFDDKESLSPRELALEKWHNGWWWDDGEPQDDGESTDEQFLAWWDERHVN